jgi:hypothetical protein
LSFCFSFSSPPSPLWSSAISLAILASICIHTSLSMLVQCLSYIRQLHLTEVSRWIMIRLWLICFVPSLDCICEIIFSPFKGKT